MRRAGQRRGALLLGRAIDEDDWEPYETEPTRALGDDLRTARDDALAGWHDGLCAFGQRLMPLVVRAYHATPARLIAALAAMQSLQDRRMVVLAEEYLRTRELLGVEAEKGRRDAEARFSRLADAGVIGILVCELGGKVVEINDHLLKLLGFSRDEVLSPAFNWADRTPPDCRGEDASALSQLQTVGVARLREKDYLRKNGERVPVPPGDPAMLGDAEERQTISFVLDVTERRRAAAQIATLERERDAESRFRQLIEAAPDAMVIVGRGGRSSSSNAQTEKLFGYTRDELVGNPRRDVDPGLLRAVATPSIARALLRRAKGPRHGPGARPPRPAPRRHRVPGRDQPRAPGDERWAARLQRHPGHVHGEEGDGGRQLRESEERFPAARRG